MMWKVTQEDEIDRIWEGAAYDCEDAAQKAVRHWYAHGVWSGDPVPDYVNVIATPECNLHKVSVRISFEPHFYPCEIKE